MKIIDTFLFYNELDLLDIRLNTLCDVVDFFILVEARLTFSGKEKELYYENNKERFAKFNNKIIHFVVENDFLEPDAILFTNPNLVIKHKHLGVALENLDKSVKREVFQRDSIQIPLSRYAKDNDIVLLSDLDEIPDPYVINTFRSNFSAEIYHFEQKWFMYWFNNLNTKKWYGTRAFKYKKVKEASLDQLRYPTEDISTFDGAIIENSGWHFSYIGNSNVVLNKINALARQGLRADISKILINTFPFLVNLILFHNKDILLRKSTFKTYEIDQTFPKYIVENLDKFKSYIKK